MSSPTGHSSHWDNAYTTKDPSDVSWYQRRPDVSLDFIARTGARHDCAIIDIGGGASTLVDHLLAAGFSNITVLDLSETALEHSRRRLGPRASFVTWIADDIVKWMPRAQVDIWHDRAALHFLTEKTDQDAYGEAARKAVRTGGWVIVAGFAKGGPIRCSGLDIVQHDAASLAEILGPDFELRETQSDDHTTPKGAGQLFTYHVFQRRP